MTTERRRRGTWKGSKPLIAAVAAVCALIAPSSLAQAMTERVVSDRYSGLAIGGIDPVSYFTQGAMVRGRPDLEVAAEGVVWRFSNDSHRAFFAANPQIYAPLFGGYDPVGIAKGKTIAGSPELWLIYRERLFLFDRPESRDAFAADPARMLDAATQRWVTLLETLAAE